MHNAARKHSPAPIGHGFGMANTVVLASWLPPPSAVSGLLVAVGRCTHLLAREAPWAVTGRRRHVCRIAMGWAVEEASGHSASRGSGNAPNCGHYQEPRRRVCQLHGVAGAGLPCGAPSATRRRGSQLHRLWGWAVDRPCRWMPVDASRSQSAVRGALVTSSQANGLKQKQVAPEGAARPWLSGPDFRELRNRMMVVFFLGHILRVIRVFAPCAVLSCRG